MYFVVLCFAVLGDVHGVDIAGSLKRCEGFLVAIRCESQSQTPEHHLHPHLRHRGFESLLKMEVPSPSNFFTHLFLAST